MSEVENKILIRRMLAGEVDYLEQWASDAVWTIQGLPTLCHFHGLFLPGDLDARATPSNPMRHARHERLS
jgi:hypothetical protein